MNILTELRRRFATALAAFTDRPDEFALLVQPAQDPRHGDYQANCAMPLAKEQKKNPRQVATELLAKLDLADLCQTPEIAGPGFINLRLRDDWLAAHAAALAHDPRLGVSPADPPRTYVVDYSSPNVAKPMHVGHLRSTVIGDALCRMLKYAGHKVISDNHVGDWGTQFGMIIYGYKHFLDRESFARTPVAELARLYRLVNQLSSYFDLRVELPRLDVALAEKLARLAELEAPGGKKDAALEKTRKKLLADVEAIRDKIRDSRDQLSRIESSPALRQMAAEHPEIATRAREETAKLHAGDPENSALWKEFVPMCLAAIQQVYDRLDIHFDHTLGESAFNPMLPDVVSGLASRGLARESEGAMCVFLPERATPFIVRKGDGAYTYATTDLATLKFRVEQWKADAILYVVDFRQGDHFEMLFETARLWGLTAVELQHIKFGTVLDKHGKPIKTREGDPVGLESLLDTAVDAARRFLESEAESSPLRADLTEETKKRIAQVVGLGGIKYADLKHNRESDYEFDEDKMVNKSGDTATYIQYAYARTQGIFRRGGIDREAVLRSGVAIQVSQPAERALALQLARWPEAVDGALGDYRPNFLTDYLYHTANLFTTFFEACPVLKAESEELRNSRLLLCDTSARVISTGLGLLGIQTIDVM